MKQMKKEIYEAINYSKENPNESLTQVAKDFNIDRHTLSKYQSIDLNTYFYSKNFDCYIFFDEKEKQAIEEYTTTNSSYADIKKKYGYKQERMVEKLKAIDYDISRKFKVNFNRNAFDKIEIEEDAYILGFILADGYINEDRHFLSIKVQAKDVDIVEKINNYLQSDGQIKDEIHGITGNIEKVVTYNSKQLVNNLKQYGLHQRKSTIEVPYTDMKDELLKHYIRGIIDGDGYIIKTRMVIGACGSKEVMTFIKDYLTKKLNLDEDKDARVYFEEKYSIYRLYFSKKASLKVIEFLYKDANIYLNRKYELAMEKMNCRV